MDTQAFFKQAFLFYRQNKFQDAHRLLTTLLKASPNIPQAWHLMALVQRKLGEYSQSFQSFENALRLMPEDPEVLNNYGNLLRQFGMLVEARTVLAKAINIQPRFTNALFNLACVLRDTYNEFSAIKYLRKILEIKPNDKAALSVLIRIYLRASDLKSASETLVNWQKENQPDADIYLLQAEISRKKGDTAQAIALLKPWQTDTKVKKALVQSYFIAGLMSEAESLIKALLKDNPLDATVLSLQAELNWQMGNSNWNKNYKEVINAAHATPEIFLAYANYLLKLGDADNAYSIICKALTVTPDDVSLLIISAYLSRELGNVEESEKLIQKCEALSLNSYEVCSEKVITQLALGNGELAVAIAKSLAQRQYYNQARWALLAACYKFNANDQAYRYLYNYDEFVFSSSISVPAGYASVLTFNMKLLEFLQSLHIYQNHPIQQSLRKGTQTEDHLFCHQHVLVQQLKMQISEVVKTYIDTLPDDELHPFLQRKSESFAYSGAWSVRLREHGFHRNHYHGDGWISGCYYVDVPDIVSDGGQGWIKFGQTELGRLFNDTPDFMIKPVAGQVVLFPSMMWHGTEAFRGETHRVTVAFDIIPWHESEENND